MSNSIFDQLRDAARRAAKDLDERFDLKNKVEQGIDTANDMARKAEAKINEATGRGARTASIRFDEQYRVTDNLRDKAAKAEDAAREVFGAAQNYYQRAEQAYNVSASGARVVEAALSGVEKARVWIKENPGKTAVVTFSMIAGVRMGSALPESRGDDSGRGRGQQLVLSQRAPHRRPSQID